MKIFCVGRNYAAHAKELENDIPDAPLIFMKPKNALLQNNTPFYYPDFSQNIQYECELVIQMCSNGKAVEERFASRYFDKIGLGIDFTARDVQSELKKKGHPWEIAKAFDYSAVLSELLPAEAWEMPLHFSLFKNGEKVQEGNTNQMLFSFNKIIAHISQFFTLNIGDLIYTGTPAGVGPVEIGDRLTGFIEEEEMFDFEIK